MKENNPNNKQDAMNQLKTWISKNKLASGSILALSGVLLFNTFVGGNETQNTNIPNQTTQYEQQQDFDFEVNKGVEQYSPEQMFDQEIAKNPEWAWIAENGGDVFLKDLLSDPKVLSFLGQAYYGNSNMDMFAFVSRINETAIKQHTDEFGYENALEGGDSATKHGNHSEASRYYIYSLIKKQDNPDALYHLAVTYTRMKISLDQREYIYKLTLNKINSKYPEYLQQQDKFNDLVIYEQYNLDNNGEIIKSITGKN